VRRSRQAVLAGSPLCPNVQPCSFIFVLRRPVPGVATRLRWNQSPLDKRIIEYG